MEKYANCLKNTSNGLKLLSYKRPAILQNMISLTFIFHGLGYNTFYHVDLHGTPHNVSLLFYLPAMIVILNHCIKTYAVR